MIKVNVGEWKSAWHEPPTEDGTYLVVSFLRGGGLFSGAILGYTVEYGWNTTSYNHEHEISFENREDVWTTLSREVENDTDREDTGI